MSTYVPKSVQEALDHARFQGQKQRSRLRVHAGDEIFPVLRRWDGGFALASMDAPQLRGLVDLYDGSRHIFQCLIVASEEEAGEMRYDFKRATPAADQAPVDFYQAPDAPAGLLTRE